MLSTKHSLKKQNSGSALIVVLFIIALGVSAYSINLLNASELKAERDRKTGAALAEAKAALLGYSFSANLNSTTCTTNCARPGDLPCPDTNNDGTAELSCGNAAGTTSQAARLGRLPWKTLGLPDIRDGNGERLWYAVSNRYKYNTRFTPLNSDTLGTITIRDSVGNIINNGSAGNGVVAVILSVGPPLTRQDGIFQSREAVNENIATNYLDIAGEDNAAFVDGTTDGFIVGPVKDAIGNTILNDSLLAITREDMITGMEKRVLSETINNFMDYYCGVGNANYMTRTCVSSLLGNRFFPKTANFSDTTCLGNTIISGASCAEGSLVHGRIPANPSTGWTSTSIFRAASSGNWFQQNGWRELIHYAVAPACYTGTTICNGSGGRLTLNNAEIAGSKQLILLMMGPSITGQFRSNNTEKSSELNYLEDENLLPLDNTYQRTFPLTSLVNDRAVSLP